jgi:hypothetical protein
VNACLGKYIVKVVSLTALSTIILSRRRPLNGFADSYFRIQIGTMDFWDDSAKFSPILSPSVESARSRANGQKRFKEGQFVRPVNRPGSKFHVKRVAR